MRVLVSIEELVLEGVDPRERHRIGDALEAELGARLSRVGTGRRLVERGGSDAIHLRSDRRTAGSIESIAEGLAGALGAPSPHTARRER